MEKLKYISHEKISLKNHPDFNERWVQDRIAEQPSIIGLGDIILKDYERIQPHAGRLDLLLQNIESKQRYEVELQLGKLDESHIIRAIEYWDLERKRYPQYDHCAVIIAEDITSRFLNVIQLFNGHIPIIAIQMSAIKIDEFITLEFTIVLNQIMLGFTDEDEDVKEPADRDYWINRGSETTVKMSDRLLNLIHTFDNSYELKYNKYYIGLSKDSKPDNFVFFKPRKSYLLLHAKLSSNVEEIDNLLEESGLDYEFIAKWGLYRIRLNKGEVKSNSEAILSFIHYVYKTTH